MKWIQKYEKLVLRDYPFFYINIREIEKHGNRSYETGYMFEYPRQQFNTLGQAKSHIETLLYREFKKSLPLIDLVTSLKDFEAIPHVYVSHTLWCNNNGDGRYHAKPNYELWKRYQWIEGRFSITSAISKRYALRYDISVPETEVKHHAVVVIKRQINKFISEYEKHNRIS